ncbi:MAG: leucine-rich repeat protein, partial [Prevotella sp.]|nr:leucine-rich repeat protein [Prevotella sp.]
MNYPLISEYIEAIEAAEDNFNELTNLRPVQGDDGKPVMTSGNFAVVFKMRDEETGKFYALKCFTKEQEGRAEAYHQIAKELKDVDSPYLVSLRYLEKELFVDTKQTDETEFPVLLMDWVEGKTLDKYLRENLDDKYSLEMLAYRFSQLAQWLIPQPFAHGDLKPDNILVREDCTLVLVDYDGMYVPAMKGQKARELGSPDFRHPLRTEDDFDSHIDDFALVSILLSLEAIYINRHLFDKYSNDGRLLFSADDYRNLGESTLLKDFFPSSVNSINNLTALLVLLCNNQHFNIQHPDLLIIDYLSTNDTEYNEKLRDDDGAMYSDDGKRLLGYGSYSNTGIYEIKEGTIVICDLAFNNYENDNHFLSAIQIPSSVSIIGINPFAGCIGLSIYCDSKLFKQELDILYSNDFSLLISSTNSTTEVLALNPNTKVIGAYALSFCRAKKIQLPRHLQIIEEFAFSFSDVELIIIPEVVKSISRGAFSDCKSLKDVIIKGETIIDPSIFDGCTNLKHIFVTSSKIEYYKKILSNVANKIYEVGTWEDCLLGVVNYAKEIFELGKTYWVGKGIKKDLNEAVRLYELASELGDEDAKKELDYWGQYWFDEDKALYSKDRTTFHGVLHGFEYEIKEGTKFIADAACSDMGWECDCSYFSKLTIPNSIIGI